MYICIETILFITYYTGILYDFIFSDLQVNRIYTKYHWYYKQRVPYSVYFQQGITFNFPLSRFLTFHYTSVRLIYEFLIGMPFITQSKENRKSVVHIFPSMAVFDKYIVIKIKREE